MQPANCKWNLQIVSGIRILFADSTYICGFHLDFADSTYILRNPLIVANSRTTSYICLLRNPLQNKYADKNYITGILTPNLRNFCRWKPLTFWNILRNLSLEYRNKQTQNCALIQYTVWPRNVELGLKTISCNFIK